MFRGMIEPEQAFPYPNVLNTDQRETLEILVPPTEKFMSEVIDPALNDTLETVPEEHVQVSRSRISVLMISFASKSFQYSY